MIRPGAWRSSSTWLSPWRSWVWRTLSTDAHRFFGEANNELSRLVDGRLDRFALLRTKGREYVVGRVHTAWRPANTDPQATKRARTQSRNDVAQTVVAAVAATVPLSNFSRWQVEVVVDDEQAFSRGAPALDCLQDNLPAIVHESIRQDKPRAAHRYGHQPGRSAQAQACNCLADRARPNIVSSALVVPLGVAQPDDNARSWISGGETIGGHRLGTIMYDKQKGRPHLGTALLTEVILRPQPKDPSWAQDDAA